ncbi:helix-turn-helix domain-containing protein [bacterium]|nr:helix-turn-helix domain-containing protein [bacterium]
MDNKAFVKETLAKKIAGEIVLSSDAGKTIQKWRNIFKVPQRRLADEMHVMPSVVSDYESGRRKSPGIKVIKRIVENLINIDEKTGENVLKYFSSFPSETILSNAVIDLKEFSKPVSVNDFCKTAQAALLVRGDLGDNNIYGYTIIDSLKAIIELPPVELVKLYGLTSERSLIFTNVKRGRSPMVALKVSNLKPGLVVFHGIESVDEVAKRIGEVENIPIAVCKSLSIDELIKELKKKFE